MSNKSHFKALAAVGVNAQILADIVAPRPKRVIVPTPQQSFFESSGHGECEFKC